MKHITTEFLKMRINSLLQEIREADQKYWCYRQQRCYRLALFYRKALDRLFIELADVNISFLREKARNQLDNLSTLVALRDMGIVYNEADGLIYI